MTFLCIPARMFLLPRFFEGWELNLLDGEDDEIEEWLTLKKALDKKNEMGDTSRLSSEADDVAKEVDAFMNREKCDKSLHAVHMDLGANMNLQHIEEEHDESMHAVHMDRGSNM